jgi:phosphoribosyl 1,2-cyclic phosphate phosphodiesterase
LRRTPHVTHMNFEEAQAVVDVVKPREAWFTHIADEIMHARDEPTLPAGTRIAYDGLRLVL